MIFWLDWKLFGNGRGMASPYFDDKFYWLRDQKEPRDTKPRGGCLYHWVGGFGAQLASFEWSKPDAGTRRRLFGHEFEVFSVHRRWLRVEVSWARVEPVRDAETIRALRRGLEVWGHGQ